MADGPAARAASKLPQEADDFIREYWERHSVEELARMAGLGPETVRQRGIQLGLTPRRQIVGMKRQPGTRGPRSRKVQPHRGRPAAVPRTPTAWPDGWSIAPPTEAQLMAGR